MSGRWRWTVSTPALQTVDGSCKRSSNEIIPAEANRDPLGASYCRRWWASVCPGPAGSELDFLAKSKQLGWSRDQERCRHSVSGNRDHVQHWKCWESNRRKAGAAQEKMWTVKQRNNVWSWRYSAFSTGDTDQHWRQLATKRKWSEGIPPPNMEHDYTWHIFCSQSDKSHKTTETTCNSKTWSPAFCLLTMTIPSSFTALSLTEKLQCA